MSVYYQHKRNRKPPRYGRGLAENFMHAYTMFEPTITTAFEKAPDVAKAFANSSMGQAAGAAAGVAAGAAAAAAQAANALAASAQATALAIQATLTLHDGRNTSPKQS